VFEGIESSDSRIGSVISFFFIPLLLLNSRLICC